MNTLLSVVVIALLCLPAVGFQEGDAQGCKDSKLMTRFRGCTISECRAKEFDTAQMLVGRDPAADEILRDVDGVLEEITYICPEGISAVQLSRNAEAALRQAGFTIVYNGKDGWDNPAVTGSRGGQWVFVRQSPSSNAYTMLAVLQKTMSQEMSVNAEDMAAAIEKSGRVAVYGITFDTGKATLKPESEAALGEIQKMFSARGDWHIRVEGHTDNIGSKAANQTLSAQRAESVAAWLTAHGIDKARLTTQGFGDSKPIGDNSTEEGRAQNRRVELVKF